MLPQNYLCLTVHKSLIFMLVASPVIINACTAKQTSNTTTANPAMTEAVSPSASNQTPAITEEIPVELKDAGSFDPAATLDPKAVQESDFYQVKQSVEQNKATLEISWKEQERLEQSVKNAKKIEEERKTSENKKEEEERERQRQLAIQEYEKSQAKMQKESMEADEQVKKLPTINQNEVMWQGLEH